MPLVILKISLYILSPEIMVCYLKARCQAGSMAPVCFSNKNPTMVLERPGGRPVVCSFFLRLTRFLKSPASASPPATFFAKNIPWGVKYPPELGFGSCQTRVWQVPNQSLAAAKHETGSCQAISGEVCPTAPRKGHIFYNIL